MYFRFSHFEGCSLLPHEGQSAVCKTESACAKCWDSKKRRGQYRYSARDGVSCLLKRVVWLPGVFEQFVLLRELRSAVNMSLLTLEAKLERTDSSTPWGFRMQGGKDFSSPLTIQRVSLLAVLKCLFFFLSFFLPAATVQLVFLQCTRLVALPRSHSALCTFRSNTFHEYSDGETETARQQSRLFCGLQSLVCVFIAAPLGVCSFYQFMMIVNQH